MSDQFENEVIMKLNVRRFKNTTIYENECLFILSPYINNSYHWFDIRLVNSSKFPKNKIGYLIIRDSKYGIHICKLLEFIDKMTSDNSCVTTKNSGKHWKYFLEYNFEKRYYIKNQHNKEIYYCDFDNIDCLQKE